MTHLPPLTLKSDVEDFLRLSFQQRPESQNSAKHNELDSFSQLLGRMGTPPLFTSLRVNPNAGKGPDELLSLIRSEIMKKYNAKGWKEPNMYYHSVIKELLVIEGRGPNLSLQQHQKQVIVDLACGMAVLRGADVFVQGIMGCLPGAHAGDTVSVYSDITGGCLRGALKPYTGEKVFIGNGILLVSREQLFCSEGKISGVGISMTEPLYEAPCLTGFCPNLVFPQNLPSVVCGLILDAKPGETILDMCAAPGGKTVHIAAMMQNKGRVVALDKTQAKIEKIKKNAENWSMSCIDAYQFDSRDICSDDADPGGCPPYPTEMFDRVLLDGPCSALGQRPTSRNKMTLKILQSYPKLQKQLFHQAVNVLKPNGILVYSTCTITMAENEELVSWALSTFPRLSLEKMKPHLGKTGRQCLGLNQEDQDKLQLFLPDIGTDILSVENDTIGFFIAKFKKTSS